MKKIILIAVTLLIVCMCGVSNVAYAEQVSTTNYTKSFTYEFVEEFCREFPDRKAGITVNDPKDSPLQKYLIDKVDTMSNGKAEITTQAFNISEYSCAYNIVARLNGARSDKQIIIGAHYDSDGQGANDNASGVAALLITIQQLSANAVNLPCNIVFVLFDGEELGFYGSSHYISLMSQTEKENTLVMINIDCIANGDNLYVWCENKHTQLADLFVSKSDKLKEKPYAQGTYNLDAGLGYGYIETPQNSDQTPFRMQGIPTALFFSGTYSADLWNYAESTNPIKNNMNTSSDTFENLDKNNQYQFVEKVETTADVIVKAVLDDSFVDVATNQRNQLVNYNVLGRSLWAKIICFGLILILAALAFVYLRKLQKRAILGTAEVKNNKVFSTPDADDIFKFDTKKTDDDKPPVEDIFTFNDKK